MITTLLLATVVSARAGLTYNTDQTADGTSFVVVAGKFEATDDLARFRETVRSHHVRMVGFNSPGGNIAKALELGRLIRAFGLDTVQIKRAECASACALAFMGGVRRMAEAGAIGVHKSAFANPDQIGSGDAVSAVQDITAEMIDYMVEMSVDPALLRLSLRYGSDDMRYLSQSEMALYRVVTGDGHVDPPNAPEPSDIPSAPQPKVQLDPDFNACRANGVVAGLDPSGDGFLAVRSGPGTQYGEIDRFYNGEQVNLCSASGKWLEVVYSKQRQNCNVTSPQSHTGACGFGWVHRNWIKQTDPSDMPPSLPPKIHADPHFDACRGNGVVEGLDPSGDGFLAVRGGPGAQYDEIDRLHNGEQVYLCSASGKWFEVVYSKQRQNCNVTSPQSHTGACGFGWVHRNWIRQWRG